MSRVSGTNKKLLALVEWGALVILLGGMLGYVIFLSVGNGKANDRSSVAEVKAEETEDTSLRSVLNQEESEEPENTKKEKAKVPEGNFQVTMTTTWNYDSIDIPAEDSYIENAWDNTNDMKFIVALAEDESKILYSSPLMPVGSFMKKIPIKNVTLDAGSYDCVVVYTLYIPDSDEETGKVRVGLKINIEN